MRLKHFSEQGDGGVTFKVEVISAEGIWHLFNLVTVGDTIKTKTVRKLVTKEGQAAQRRVLMLTIQVTHPAEYDAKGVLRISGRNRVEVEGIRNGAHHTHEIRYDPPQEVSVEKVEWNNVLHDRLKKACDPASKADAAAVTLQEGLANVCLISGSMTTVIAKVENSVPKKKRGSSEAHDGGILKFYNSVGEAMVSHLAVHEFKAILICGPGTIAEEFLNHMLNSVKNNTTEESGKNSGALKIFFSQKSRFVTAKVSNGTKGAIKEALNDSSVANQLMMAKCMGEMDMMRKFQDIMSKDPDRCTYGVDHCFAAYKDEAIESLMLLDVAMRSPVPEERNFYANLYEAVQELGGNVVVVSSANVMGEELYAMGGIAAILRMPLPQLDEIEAVKNFPCSDIATKFVQDRLQSNIRVETTNKGKSF